jgi:hypothetical protein
MVAPLVAEIAIGRVEWIERGEGFSARRTADEAVVFGPAIVSIEGHGEVQVPAGTVIDRPCPELRLALSNESPPGGGPCYVRADVDTAADVIDMWIINPTVGEDGSVLELVVGGTVVGATETEVLLQDKVRDRVVAWPLAPDVEFFCGGEWWTPPDFPSPPSPTSYFLSIDDATDLVTYLRCSGGF